MCPLGQEVQAQPRIAADAPGTGKPPPHSRRLGFPICAVRAEQSGCLGRGHTQQGKRLAQRSRLLPPCMAFPRGWRHSPGTGLPGLGVHRAPDPQSIRTARPGEGAVALWRGCGPEPGAWQGPEPAPRCSGHTAGPSAAGGASAGGEGVVCSPGGRVPTPTPRAGRVLSPWSPGPFREAVCLHPADAWAPATAPLARPPLPSISPYRPICRISAQPAAPFGGRYFPGPAPGRPCPPPPRACAALCPATWSAPRPAESAIGAGAAISGNLSAAIGPIGGPGAARPRDGANP